MEKTLTIKIGKDGKLSLDFENYSGGQCLKELEEIAAKLKAEIVKKDEKIEYYEAEINTKLWNTLKTGGK